ncbi:MAE_28990/MAE_18760 family HEPN-like nuclease [Agaribacterium haliotis]|uniref:MAE_28990/MAE_18760 family HEPN-like nuclease n=1 Tax=Agaribacterium haliotis TaxID=2013869 RepID=UPI000BB574BE|nr:MAE_28990/MAE_18760 family HEPN-like nuclease [Agaribacterium haliotis]
MDHIVEDFNQRVSEIDSYLKVIALLSENCTRVVKTGQLRRRERQVDREALKVMRATVMLMLYNLVESSIRSSFSFLYEEINSSEKTLEDVTTKIQNEWIKQQFVNVEPISSNQVTYRDLTFKIINEVLRNEALHFDPEKLPISGNIDARQVRKLAERHNIHNPIHYKAREGAELLTVKNQRNSLSHGNSTFTEVGNMYTVDDLQRIKKQVVTYLKSTLKNINRYADKTQYAK